MALGSREVVRDTWSALPDPRAEGGGEGIDFTSGMALCWLRALCWGTEGGMAVLG